MSFDQAVKVAEVLYKSGKQAYIEINKRQNFKKTYEYYYDQITTGLVSKEVSDIVQFYLYNHDKKAISNIQDDIMFPLQDHIFNDWSVYKPCWAVIAIHAIHNSVDRHNALLEINASSVVPMDNVYLQRQIWNRSNNHELIPQFDLHNGEAEEWEIQFMKVVRNYPKNLDPIDKEPILRSMRGYIPQNVANKYTYWPNRVITDYGTYTPACIKAATVPIPPDGVPMMNVGVAAITNFPTLLAVARFLGYNYKDLPYTKLDTIVMEGDYGVVIIEDFNMRYPRCHIVSDYSQYINSKPKILGSMPVQYKNTHDYQLEITKVIIIKGMQHDELPTWVLQEYNNVLKGTNANIYVAGEERK